MTISHSKDTIVIEPSFPAKMSVIWLHGLGADSSNFVPVIEALRLSSDAHIRFVFPNAPMRPIGVNGGMMMRGWYDIKSYDLTFQEDESGILESVERVRHLINIEHSHGMPVENIVIAGFSQGGAIALQVALRFSGKLAGILALSTYLPLIQKLPVVEGRLDLPIAMYHGLFDPIVPFHLGQFSKQKLESVGFNIEWLSFPMAHVVCDDELDAIQAWLLKRYHSRL